MVKVSLAIVATILLATFTAQVIGTRPATDCTVKVTLPGERPQIQQVACKNQLSWAAWVVGKSRSPQVHFLDLLELVFGKKQPKKQGFATWINRDSGK